MMAYNAENCCVYGLRPLSGILITREYSILETRSFSIFVVGERHAFLERLNLKYWIS
jgi:hypothetical protein